VGHHDQAVPGTAKTHKVLDNCPCYESHQLILLFQSDTHSSVFCTAFACPEGLVERSGCLRLRHARHGGRCLRRKRSHLTWYIPEPLDAANDRNVYCFTDGDGMKDGVDFAAGFRKET
jgi:hypothetical protein